jgi:hypothetical protein
VGTMWKMILCIFGNGVLAAWFAWYFFDAYFLRLLWQNLIVRIIGVHFDYFLSDSKGCCVSLLVFVWLLCHVAQCRLCCFEYVYGLWVGSRKYTYILIVSIWVYDFFPMEGLFVFSFVLEYLCVVQ